MSSAGVPRRLSRAPELSTYKDLCPTIYAASGNPVMRTPPCPLWRMLSPINSAVICSTMRAVSSLPPSIARMRGIFAASSIATCEAAGSSLQTITFAIDILVAVQHIGRHIVERSDHRDTLGH